MSSVDEVPSEQPAALSPEPFLHRHLELIIAVMLGLVSIFTAYASFQSSLYDGNQAQAYTNGTNMATEAESLYLEANQQYVRDAQLFERLLDLGLDSESSDPAIAESAQQKLEAAYFQAVSPEFDAAIQWATAQNDADVDNYYSPLDNEDYQAFLFGPYAEMKEQAVVQIAEGDQANTHGDRLTLTTVMMALSLFLLGLAAVVRGMQTKLLLGAFSTVIFVVAAVIMLAVPALPLF